MTILSGAIMAFFLQRLLAAIAREKRSKEESESLLRAVFENAAVGLVQISSDGRILDINQEFCRIVGGNREQMTSHDHRLQRLNLPEGSAASSALPPR